jgi:formiminotetrahydrofolate cyclodeaminase
MKLIELSVRDYVKQLASGEATPGGGSAAALSCAMAAGLCAMAARLTIGKAKYVKSWTRMQLVVDQVSTVEQTLLSLVDEDSEAYKQVLAAYRLPKNDDDQKKRRQAAIESAFQLAASVPMQTLQQAAQLVEPLQSVIAEGNPNCITDAGAAVQFCRAGAQAAADNVRINLEAIRDNMVVSEFEKKCAGLWNQVDTGTKQLDEQVAARMS